MKPRDMSRTYRHMNLFDLQELKSRKQVRLRRLRNSYGYLDMQEVRRIEFNIKQIDVEIACKSAQMELL